MAQDVHVVLSNHTVTVPSSQYCGRAVCFLTAAVIVCHSLESVTSVLAVEPLLAVAAATLSAVPTVSRMAGALASCPVTLPLRTYIYNQIRHLLVSN